LALDAGRAAEMIGFFWIGLLLGRLTVGLVPRPPSASTTAMLALTASVMLTAFLSHWGPAPELILTSTGFALGGVFPIMIGFAGASRPDATGRSVALAAGLGSIGGFTIPWLTGILATRISLTIALFSLSLWLVLLAVACAIVHRHPRRHPF
jgi:fucose permease